MNQIKLANDCCNHDHQTTTKCDDASIKTSVCPTDVPNPQTVLTGYWFIKMLFMVWWDWSSSVAPKYEESGIICFVGSSLQLTELMMKLLETFMVKLKCKVASLFLSFGSIFWLHWQFERKMGGGASRKTCSKEPGQNRTRGRWRRTPASDHHL